MCYTHVPDGVLPLTQLSGGAKEFVGSCDMEIPNSSHTFELNESQVVCEAIDNDLVLVHFESGLYYSIRGIGSDVYRCLMAGATIADVANRLTQNFPASASRAEEEVRRFVLGLLDDDVLRIRTSNPTPDTMCQVAATLTVRTYEPPRFEKFDDMADQLLLDKIDDDTRQAVWVTDTVIVAPHDH